MNKTPHVFISATREDLRPYCQAAVAVCNKLKLVPIDMDTNFVATSAGATEGSQAQIAKADVFVGVYAYRYGYSEPGCDKSVTECEYDFAIERKLECLCFVVDPDYGWPPKLVDNPRDKIEAFRARVDKRHIRGSFTTVEDFRSKLEGALREWMDGRSTAAPASDGPSVWQIPSAFSDFTGREKEVGMVTDALGTATTRTIIISGLPGTGKSQLAFHLAAKLKHRFPDGGFFCALHGYDESPTTAHEAMKRILWSLKPGSTLPEDDEQLANAYRSEFAGKRRLLLLDNARDVAQVEALLLPEPSVVVITSRCALQIPAALCIGLSEFAATDAIMFLRKLNGRLQGHEEKVATACGNLPMALRLAAGALVNRPHLSVEEYIRLLGDAEARSDYFPSLQVQYDLLTKPMQQQLVALTLFRRGFTVAAAAGVWGVSRSEAEKFMVGLYEFSLVTCNPVTHRFFLHDLVRQFAAAHWEKGSVGEAERRHAEYHAGVARDLRDLHLKGGQGVIESLRAWDEQCEDLQTAFAWAYNHATESRENAQICADLADGCWYFYEIRYTMLARIVLAQGGVKAAQFLGDETQLCLHLRRLGFLSAHIAPAQAEPLLQHALMLAKKLGDGRAEGIVEGYRGLAFQFAGNLEDALKAFESSLAMARERDDGRQLGIALGRLGYLHTCRKDLDLALKYYKEAIEVEERIGDYPGLIFDHTNAARACNLMGRMDDALNHLEVAADTAQRIRDDAREIAALEFMAELAVAGKADAFRRAAAERLRAALLSKAERGEAGLDQTYLILATQKRWVLASIVADILVTQSPDSASAWLRKAEAVRHLQPDGLEQEKRVLTEARDRFPEDSAVPYNLACNAADCRKNDDALAWLREAMRKHRDPKSVRRQALADNDLLPIRDAISSIPEEGA